MPELNLKGLHVGRCLSCYDFFPISKMKPVVTEMEFSNVSLRNEKTKYEKWFLETLTGMACEECIARIESRNY